MKGLVDKKGNTILHIAVIDNLEDLFESCLGHHGLIDERNYAGKTALHLASEYGRIWMVERLIHGGANIELTCYTGDPYGDSCKFGTPLHHACGMGHGKVVRLLLSAGADARGDYGGGCPMDWARESGQTAVIDMLSSCLRPM